MKRKGGLLPSFLQFFSSLSVNLKLSSPHNILYGKQFCLALNILNFWLLNTSMFVHSVHFNLFMMTNITPALSSII